MFSDIWTNWNATCRWTCTCHTVGCTSQIFLQYQLWIVHFDHPKCRGEVQKVDGRTRGNLTGLHVGRQASIVEFPCSHPHQPFLRRYLDIPLSHANGVESVAAVLLSDANVCKYKTLFFGVVHAWCYTTLPFLSLPWEMFPFKWYLAVSFKTSSILRRANLRDLPHWTSSWGALAYERNE